MSEYTKTIIESLERLWKQRGAPTIPTDDDAECVEAWLMQEYGVGCGRMEPISDLDDAVKRAWENVTEHPDETRKLLGQLLAMRPEGEPPSAPTQAGPAQDTGDRLPIGDPSRSSGLPRFR